MRTARRPQARGRTGLRLDPCLEHLGWVPLLPPEGSASLQRSPLTFSVSRSFTVGKGVLVDILLRFDSAQRQGENKTAQLWAAGEQRPRASGPCPPRPESRSPAWPGPCARGPRGSFSPSAGGRGEEPSRSGPVGRRKPQGASRAPRLLAAAAPRNSAPRVPHRAARSPRRGGGAGECSGDEAQDRPLRPAGADHGGGRAGGAHALLLSLLRSLSARPRPADCHRRSPAPQEPHRPKMAVPRLPPLPTAAGSDAADAWSSANQRGWSQCRLLLLGATRPVGSEQEVSRVSTSLVSSSSSGVPMVQSAWASLTPPGHCGVLRPTGGLAFTE